jgi:hypothetical protein
MFNKHTTTALYAAVIASVLVASVLAISYVQMALAQGNQTSGAAGGTNQSSSNSTSSGGGAATGASGDPNFWKKNIDLKNRKGCVISTTTSFIYEYLKYYLVATELAILYTL